LRQLTWKTETMIYSNEQIVHHMTLIRSEQEQRLYVLTDQVLFTLWDALCLSIDHEYRDQYIRYVPHIFDLLLETEDGQDLHDYLVFVEENEMRAFKGDVLVKLRASRVVHALLEHKKEIMRQ